MSMIGEAAESIAAWAAREQATLDADVAKHNWVNPHAGSNCDNGHCQWRDGGLETCDTCGAFEGATTTQCPGSKVSPDVWDAVYAGLVDYRQGAWQRRETRWIEGSRGWGARPPVPPPDLILTGLPEIDVDDAGVGVGHLAVFDPSTGTSTCVPGCEGCARAVRTAVEQVGVNRRLEAADRQRQERTSREEAKWPRDAHYKSPNEPSSL